MRAIWKGAVAFGLVSVPVKLYAATGEHNVPLHQVHREDGGRIRYRKVCSACGQEVSGADIVKGYVADGETVMLTEEDFEALPLATEREIAVLEFVPAEQVDPILYGKSYYLEPEKIAAKPYALLRKALEASDRMAVVKVALRQRESMAVLRVRGDVIVLQTILWPDEVREASFPVLREDVEVRPQELQMATSLVESLAGDFDPSQFEDAYQSALEELITAKVTAGRTVEVPQPTGEAEEGGEVIDLLAALQRSVAKVRSERGEPEAEAEDEQAGAKGSKGSRPTPAERAGSGSGSRSGAKPAGKKPAVKKPAAKKAAAKSSTAKKAGATSGSRAGASASSKEKGATGTARRRAS